MGCGCLVFVYLVGVSFIGAVCVCRCFFFCSIFWLEVSVLTLVVDFSLFV